MTNHLLPLHFSRVLKYQSDNNPCQKSLGHLVTNHLLPLHFSRVLKFQSDNNPCQKSLHLATNHLLLLHFSRVLKYQSDNNPCQTSLGHLVTNHLLPLHFSRVLKYQSDNNPCQKSLGHLVTNHLLPLHFSRVLNPTTISVKSRYTLRQITFLSHLAHMQDFCLHNTLNVSRSHQTMLFQGKVSSWTKNHLHGLKTTLTSGEEAEGTI